VSIWGRMVAVGDQLSALGESVILPGQVARYPGCLVMVPEGAARDERVLCGDMALAGALILTAPVGDPPAAWAGLCERLDVILAAGAPTVVGWTVALRDLGAGTVPVLVLDIVY